MPLRRSFKKRSYRKRSFKPKTTFHRKFRGAKRRIVRHRSGKPFPTNMYCKLRYSENFTIVDTTGVLNICTISANSLYDPDQSNIGHQPRYFDTLCGADSTGAPYGQYRVFGAKISVKFMNGNASAGSQGYVGIRLRNATSTTTNTLDVTALPELPNTKYRMCNVQTGLSNFVSVSMYSNNKKFLGIRDMKDNPNTAAAYNADPATQVLFDCFYAPFDENTSATMQAVVMVTYYCQFFDLNLPAIS